MKQPLIKWTGSKRPIAKEIIGKFPRTIETYYEPFLGGGSVFLNLLKNDHDVERFRLSDKNSGLIGIFDIVKDNPESLIHNYQQHWWNFQESVDYYYVVRDNYNKTKDPYLLYFLSRTCYNGTIRYNKKGEFNVSHHMNRKGMAPSKIEEIILYYHKLMKDKDIEFSCRSFEEVCPESLDDVVYCDPPYTNSKALYHGNIPINQLTSWLNGLPCSWFMNINGVNGSDNEIQLDIPYTGKELFRSGNSSFSRLKMKSVVVEEYFYYSRKK